MSDFSSRLKTEGRGGQHETAASSSTLAQIEMVSGRTIAPAGVQIAPGIRVTRLGLHGAINNERQWEVVGRTLRGVESGLQWAIGDWLNIAEDHAHEWGTRYQLAAEMIGFDPATLRQYAYVARQVNLSVRTDKLTFTHHQLVAALEPDQQAAWLDMAEGEGWSVARMRAEMSPKQIGGDWYSTAWEPMRTRLDKIADNAPLKAVPTLIQQLETLVETLRRRLEEDDA